MAVEGSEHRSAPATAVAEARHREADVRQADLAQLPPLAGDWPAPGSVPVCVLVPAKNEQANLVACLRRLAWAAQVVVVDSQSEDDTVPLAQALGAEVYQFHYAPEGWPKKKNWALRHVPWRHAWLLIVDADEHVTPELAHEVAAVVAGRYAHANGGGDGYYVDRKYFFLGRWIRHCGYSPSWNLRLFKHAVAHYERIGALGDTQSGDNEVHEHVILATGEAGYLRHHLLHYPYPTLSKWVEKHNRYSNWESRAMLAHYHGEIAGSPFHGPIARRRWLRAMTLWLPFRAFLRFVYMYILRGGILDGYPGYVLCMLMAWHEFMCQAKYHELRQGGGQEPPRDGPPPAA